MLGDQQSRRVRRSTRERISAPAAMTSTRPGCMKASAALLGLIASSGSTAPCTASSREHAVVDQLAVVGRQVQHGGRHRGDGAGHADEGADVAGSSGGRRAPRRCRRRPPRPRHVGGSSCRCARSAAHTRCRPSPPRGPARRRRRGRARSSRRRCRRREPARGAAAARASRRRSDSAPPRRRRPPRARHPSAPRTPATNSSRLAASREADVAQNRTGADALLGTMRAYSSTAANVRSSARVGEPAGAVDALAEPDDPHLAVQRPPVPASRRCRRRAAASSWCRSRRRRPASSAALGARGRPRRTALLPPLAERVEHLVAERVHAAARPPARGRPARAGTSPGRACRRPRCPRSPAPRRSSARAAR